jgi:hypothetical protein
MSYDIRFCVETVHPDSFGDPYVVVHVPEYDSPTYNLRDMFVACMDWEYKQGVYYPMAEVLPKLKRGLAELREHPDQYRKYNPPNGWGDLEGARGCLADWIGELEDPWGITHTWPIEHLWWRW